MVFALNNFRYWFKGEPNDQSGSEDCVEILQGRKRQPAPSPQFSWNTCWNDFDCGEEKYYICEKAE